MERVDPVTVAEPHAASTSRSEIAAFLIMVAFLVVAPFFVYPMFLMQALCFALFACAFNLLLGYSGLLSFGHAMFLGTAGYVCGHAVKVWGLRRSANYGSPRLDERTLAVTRVETGPDPRTVRLLIPDLAPAQVVEITSRLTDADGAEVTRVITGTIHRVPGEGER